MSTLLDYKLLLSPVKESYPIVACGVAVSVEAPAEPETVPKPAAAAAEPLEEGFVPVCKPEDLPKGVLLCLFGRRLCPMCPYKLTWWPAGTRKEVRVGGVSLLLFWYRQQIYAIESRCEPRLRWPAAYSLPDTK